MVKISEHCNPWLVIHPAQWTDFNNIWPEEKNNGALDDQLEFSFTCLNMAAVKNGISILYTVFRIKSVVLHAGL